MNIKIIKSFLTSFSFLLTMSTLWLSSCLYAEPTHFESNTTYDVCFTPNADCTQLIVDKINHAKNSVYVLAYSFTSAPIAKSLVEAQKRGVTVKVILDKSQVKNIRYSSAKFLINQGVNTWIDFKPAIAHNKVIIIDDTHVITGSFNFTKAAQFRNTENLIVISDHTLANKYLNYWYQRQAISSQLQPSSSILWNN